MAITNYLVPAIGSGVLMTLSWILGYYGYSFVWISAFIVLSVLNSTMWRKRERRILALQQAAMREKEVVLAQLKDLPAWVQFPDTERVEWLNRVIFQIWPYLGEFTKNFIKEQVEPRVKALLPGPFRSFSFESIDMGDIPLRVGGIKVYRENVGRDRIIMDMDVAYAGDCEFVVSIGAFRAGLRQMQFKGKLRTILKPLLPKPPFVGGISAFLLDEPTIDFDLTGLGELVELPGLLGAVRSVISSQVASICVLPNEIVVPLTKETDMVKLYFPEPDGVVRIHILEAKNLEDLDMALKGKSDPYARVAVGAQTYKTKTIDNSLDPVWDEYFEAVVDQASGQRVFIELFDQDVGSADEFLGRLAIDLSVVRDRRSMDDWFALEGVKRGDLHLRIFWLEMSTEKKALSETVHHQISEVQRDGLKSKKQKGKNSGGTGLSNAVLMVYVDSASDLPSIRKNQEPSPFLELSVGNQIQKTFHRPKTPNPLYRQKFIFFVNNADSRVLKVEAKDYASNGQSIGETTVAIHSLFDEDRLELHQHQFHLTYGPHSSPVIMTLRLRFLRQASSTVPQDKVPDERVDNGHAKVEASTNQLVLPVLDLNGASTGAEAWRDTAVSPGASTQYSETKEKLATRMFHRLTRSNSKLHRRRRKDSFTPSPGGYGRLEISFQYLDNKKQLLVAVLSAEHLRSANEDGTAAPYIKARLLNDSTVVAKLSTRVKQNTLNPRFDETLKFELRPEDVGRTVLALDIKDATNYGLFARKPVLGQLIFDLARLDKPKNLHEWFDLSRPCYDNASSSRMSLRM